MTRTFASAVVAARTVLPMSGRPEPDPPEPLPEPPDPPLIAVTCFSAASQYTFVPLGMSVPAPVALGN